MKRKYLVPIMGTVIRKEPLEGDPMDPILVPSLSDLLPKRMLEQGITLVCLSYNVDNGVAEIEIDAGAEAHQELDRVVPTLKSIAASKDWKLDRTRMR